MEESTALVPIPKAGTRNSKRRMGGGRIVAGHQNQIEKGRTPTSQKMAAATKHPAGALLLLLSSFLSVSIVPVPAAARAANAAPSGASAAAAFVVPAGNAGATRRRSCWDPRLSPPRRTSASSPATTAENLLRMTLSSRDVRSEAEWLQAAPAPAAPSQHRDRQRRQEKQQLRREETEAATAAAAAAATTLREAREKNGGRIPYGEESRRYRRTIYTHEDWVKHRSENRINRNLRGIFKSGVLRQLKNEVGSVVASASLVVVWNSFVVPEFKLHELCLPVMPFTLSSPALGLLLVFRTNASYGRWWEARTKWGSIINHSVNIARMSSGAYVDDIKKRRRGAIPEEEVVVDSDEEKRLALDRVCRATWALPRSLKNKLAGEEADDECYAREIRQAFSSDDPTGFAQHVLDSPPALRPSAALLELTMALNDLPVIETARRIEIDKSIVILNDCIGSCERIFSSPVPLVYTRHTARFLSFWLLMLPLALYGSFVVDKASPIIGVFESIAYMFALGIISVFLFGIEELAVTLEEPFSILPMQNFCDRIRTTTESIKDRAVLLSDRIDDARGSVFDPPHFEVPMQQYGEVDELVDEGTGYLPFP